MTTIEKSYLDAKARWDVARVTDAWARWEAAMARWDAAK